MEHISPSLCSLR